MKWPSADNELMNERPVNGSLVPNFNILICLQLFVAKKILFYVKFAREEINSSHSQVGEYKNILLLNDEFPNETLKLHFSLI